MLSFDSLPQARVVRAGGQLVTPPPRPPEPPGALQRAVRSVLEVVLGLWPLTAALLLGLGFMILAARNASY